MLKLYVATCASFSQFYYAALLITLSIEENNQKEKKRLINK